MMLRRVVCLVAPVAALLAVPRRASPALRASPSVAAFVATAADVSLRSDGALAHGSEWSPREGPSRSVIVGGGPAGLATAIMFAKRGWREITVVDRLAAPFSPDDEAVWGDTARFYLVGLGARGQRALAHLGAWEAVERYCAPVVGRKDWAPGAGPDEGAERVFTDRPYVTQVIARDRLAGALYRFAQEHYGGQISFRHGVEVANVYLESSTVLLSDGEELTAPLLVGADGTARTVAMALEEEDGSRVRVTRYDDDNERLFKTVPLRLPSDWRGDINYSARTKDGRLNFDALPSSTKEKDYCAVLLLKADDALIGEDADAGALRALLEDELPQFNAFIDDDTVAAVAKKPSSRLPGFRYVGPDLHRGNGVVLLGDAIHTVKPYFGLGANAALEDVEVLDGLLDGSQTGSEALRAFSEARAPDAKALVQISRGFDRPGLRGFVTFILPIILDSVFHAKCPRVFGPNTIASLQQDGTFVDVRRRKRRDRCLQVAVLAAALSAFGATAKFAVARALATKQSRAAALVAAGAAALVAAASRLAGYFERGMAPADVLSKSKSTVSGSNEDFLLATVE